MTIAEKALIGRIRQLAKEGKNPAVQAGIGDDCAVLRLGPRPSGERSKNKNKTNDTLITTDFSLEGVHFRRDWHTAESIGQRCLARGLSDIAAMGGEPAAAFLSLALPRDVQQTWVSHFAHALINLAKKYNVTLAGGDTAESPNGILADIVVVGTVPKGGAVMRSGARPGDLIYVSGQLGGAAAALAEMQKKTPGKPKSKLSPQAYPRHFFPEPRIELGRALREKHLASAMIDTSDGLSTDLTHICEESGVGAEIHAELIPRATVGKPARKVDLNFALHGGEDYELLFTARSKKLVPARIAGIPINRIGRITRGKKITLIGRDKAAHELHVRGWEHFR